jgi:hypothetical protein
VRHGDISDELIALGFEKDKAWLKRLEDVQPDMSPSRAPETLTIGCRVTRIWRELTGMLVYLFRRYFVHG